MSYLIVMNFVLDGGDFIARFTTDLIYYSDMRLNLL